MVINKRKVINFSIIALLLLMASGCENNKTKDDTTIHAKEFMQKSEQIV